MTLEELSAVSTNSEWIQTENAAVNTGIVYKLLKLNHFGVYCSTDSMTFTHGNLHDLFLNSVDLILIRLKKSSKLMQRNSL
jgi:hypothetical protein